METKVCAKCEKEFPATTDFFHKGNGHLKAACKWCLGTKRKYEPEGFKYCSTCDKLLPITPEYFYASKRCRGGRAAQCIECRKEYHQKHYAINKDSILERQRKWHKENPDYYYEYDKQWRKDNPERFKAKQMRYLEKNREERYEKTREWRNNNKEKVREYYRNRYKNNIKFKVTHLLRSRLLYALKGNTKADNTLNLIGCTVEELMQYLEEKFAPGMTWGNYEYAGWHVDHIKPCASFDMTDPEQQKICFHYTNLQPMWGSENIKKGSNVNYEGCNDGTEKKETH